MIGDVIMVGGLLNKLIGTQVNTIRQEESIEVDRLKSITVSSDIATVKVLTHELPRVDIQFESYEGGPVLKTEKSEEALMIIAEKERKGSTFFFGTLPKSILQLYVPRDIADNWDIRVTSGKISMKQLIAETFRISATSGVIQATDITAGKMFTDTTSGKIIIDKLRAENLQFLANSGKVEINSSYGDITGKVGSGSVRMAEVKGEELDIRAGSGRVILNEIYMKNATIRANSGTITAEHFWSETTEANVGSGRIELRDIRGAVKGDANSGNINLEMSDNSALDLRTGSGNIHLDYQDFELDTLFDIRTGSGGIQTNIAMNTEQKDRNHLYGKVGNGKNVVRLRTGSGNVSINK
ncbi:MAG TPA: hypothetical protein DCO80_13665 [Ornithinibacillus sp.]|nr:hypothetical protein [Ornithinibacillus sp.]